MDDIYECSIPQLISLFEMGNASKSAKALILAAENRIVDELIVTRAMCLKSNSDYVAFGLTVGDIADVYLGVIGVERYDGSNDTVSDLISAISNGISH